VLAALAVAALALRLPLSSLLPPSPLLSAGKPVAFKLVPTHTPLLLAAPTSSIAKRGVFATKHLWVTPHSDAGGCTAGYIRSSVHALL